MTRLLTSLLVIFVVAGFGCTPKQPEPTEKLTTYTNQQYAFSFQYPVERMEVRDRPDNDQRRWPYVGIDTDFFMSVRDVSPKSNGQAFNIVNFYAVKDLGVEAFVSALDAEPGVDILSRDEVKMGEVLMTKIVSTTQAGIDKHHYVFDSKGSLVIISIALTEHANFEPVLETFRFIPES